MFELHLAAEAGGKGADALLPERVVAEVDGLQAPVRRQSLADDAQRLQRLVLWSPCSGKSCG